MVLRTLLPALALLLLGGCLQSKDPLIADSSYGDSLLGIYRYFDLKEGAETGPGKLVRLARTGDKIVQQDWVGAEKSWKDGIQSVRFAAFERRANEAIVEVDTPGHAYLYYRRTGSEALLWTVDCSRLSQAVREELELTLDGKDCLVRNLGQAESAIRAYMRTNPRPDYKVVEAGRSASARVALGIEEDRDGAGGLLAGNSISGDSIEDRIRRMSPLNASDASEHKAAGGDFITRATEPIGAAWTALFSGDWSGLWKAIWHSWMIFAIIAFLVGGIFACRRR